MFVFHVMKLARFLRGFFKKVKESIALPIPRASSPISRVNPDERGNSRSGRRREGIKQVQHTLQYIPYHS